MPDPIAQLADEIAAVREEAASKATLRVATVTAVEATAERRVKLDVSGDYWATTDTDAPLGVGDRVYALQQGPAWVVSGRLDGSSATTPVGAVTMYAGATPPLGWLLCQGQSLARADYPDLFAAIGTAYGSASSSTFNLPNLAGRFPLGVNASHPIAQTGGAETVTLTDAQMPSHTHAGPSHSHSMNHTHTTDPHTHSLATGAANVDSAATTGQKVADNVAGSTGSTTVTVNSYTGSTGTAGTGATGSAGSDSAHNNMPPWLALNFIVRAL